MTSSCFHAALSAFQAARQAYTDQQYDMCRESLRIAKKSFIQFASYFNPNPTSSPHYVEETVLIREALEYECLCSAKSGDTDRFESVFTQLNTYYTDFMASSKDIPESSRRWLLTGIHLLCLLVQNRIGAFHAQLECIPRDEHNNLFLRPIIELERYLLEGAYSRLLQAREAMPTNDYAAFLTALTHTISDEIARGITSSYITLDVQEAEKLLMLEEHHNIQNDKKAHVQHYMDTYHWKRLENNKLQLPLNCAEKNDTARGILDFSKLLESQLEVAMELQRIV